MTQERYFIGPGLRDKLRETITRVDGLMDREGGVKSPIVHQEMMPRGGGSAIRLCTFSGAWPIGNNKTVTFTGQTNTATVMNLFFDIGVSCGQRDAAITKINGVWHLIAASCA